MVKKLLLLALALVALWNPVFGQETHVVQPNQTLYSIARLYNVSVDQLREWNNLASPSIRVGQSLVVKPVAVTAVGTNPGLSPFVYTVRAGDSLNALSLKFDTPVETLRQINAFDSSQGLYVGQRLYIRRPVGITFYTVQPGDTVGRVSALFNLSADDLKSINQVTDATLVAGKVLRVFKPSEVPLNHTVAATDTPAGVAALYGMSVSDLQRLNGAGSLNLRAGQVLRLRPYASASQSVFQEAAPEKTLAQKAAPQVAFPDGSADRSYTVQKGDTMLKVTRAFGVRLDDLLAWNKLNADSVLHVGQVLKIKGLAGQTAPATQAAFVEAPALPKAQDPVSFPDTPTAAAELPAFRDEDQAKIRWDSYVVLDKSIPVFEWNSDYYYWTHPGEVSQPNRGYYENSWPSPKDAYQKARKLLAQFDKLIDQKGPLSTILRGYTFVIDPGHGGVDPGAIVKVTDDSGKDAYLTEHEYVYDISLRVYSLLKRHGADVQLTVLAPNHLIRDTQSPNTTLINEKNQVYNDASMNQSDDADAWPNGSQKGLEKRIAIADRAFKSVAPGRRIFLSLHADSNPYSSYGTGVYALDTRDGSPDTKSLGFAQKLVPYLGTDAYARTQNLAVLRGNDADYKVLIEVHNLASEEQSRAMRAGSSRQLSAQKIVRGVLEAFRK